MAPRNRRRQITVRAWNSPPKTVMTALDFSSASPKMASKLIVSNSKKVANIPKANPKSPTRFTTKAFMAAAQAEGRLYQKPINR